MAFYVMMSFLLALLLANHKIDFAIFVAFISWLLLTFGANLFNDYFDKDKQALIGLPKPTPVTIEILYAAYFVKALGLLLSIIYLPIYFTLIYIIGVLASIVYSGKKVRIKSKAKTSIFFSLASGSASYFSILIVIYQPNYYLDTRTIIIHLLGMVASGLFLSAFHIITQIHQKKEDESRGDNTLTVMYGKKKALLTAIAFLSLSSLILIYLFWTEVSYIIVVIFIIQILLIVQIIKF